MVLSISRNRKTKNSRRSISLAAVIVSVVLFSNGGLSVFAQDNPVDLPRGFRDILLGLDFSTVERRVSEDNAFSFRGRPDVSLALSDGEPLIDTNGRGYVGRGVFAFHENRLFSISLYLATDRLDYIQLYNQFTGKYGNPADLDPQRAIWDDGRTRIELEKPLTVRYLDVSVFEERRRASRSAGAVEDMTRRQFLELF